ncbi:MAG: hypothetical protein U0M00_01635 [Clostridia bacterium]|jgi:hypothetical protein|nr:hypothetical protein [Clostridia bacterium]CDD27519.1 unknown [Clostridium sp. CAG:452]DAI07342.1 MAG TPA: Microtubule end binding protein end binding protein complex.3A [Bacteriophage sp.]
METKKKLKEKANNAEQRAVVHFRKLQEIENILGRAEINKTPSVIVVDKIKEVIVGQNK